MTQARGLRDPKRQPPPPAPQTRVEPTFTYVRVTGGGPHLRPEESESVSLGAVLTPRILPGLRLSVDFTDIEKTGEISSLLTLLYPTLQALVGAEDALPGRIKRDPLTTQDIASGFQAGRISEVDMTLTNTARTSVRSFDIQVDYTFTTGAGNFRAYALASHLKDFTTQLYATTPEVKTVGLPSRLQWRGNAGLTFESGPWSVDWNMQYYDRYFISAGEAVGQGSATIPRQMYHDLTARLRLGEALGRNQGMFAGTELMLGLRNVFDTSPPIVATPYETVGYSFFGDPRLRRYAVSLRKSFR